MITLLKNPPGYWRLHNRKNQAKLRKKVIEKLGGKCVECGFSDTRALHIDHINSGGTLLNKTTAWHKRYKAILNDTNKEEVQLLCANCNFIKRFEKNEFYLKRR